MRLCIALLFFSLFFGCSQSALSQASRGDGTVDTGVVLTKLSPPVILRWRGRRELLGTLRCEYRSATIGAWSRLRSLMGIPY